ncbi:MAG: hypothetical protein M3T96_04420 [Acidobacteriota bacterium]|nr:hypothetical protein [Acidobacteriota bacterium]
MQFSTDGFMLEVMNELDEVWSRQLSAALTQAQTTGRGDVADYLTLRAANDEMRRASVRWLFDSLVEIASFADRGDGRISIETDPQHLFNLGNSTLRGEMARLRQGVRCLTVEAGWTRTPADGFMRGGALALGRVSHFGISKHDVELSLVLQNDVPGWFAANKTGKREVFDSRNLNEHFQIFLGTE